MSITALKKDMDAIKERRSNAFIFVHSDSAAPSRANVTAAYNFGEIREADIEFTAKETSVSTTGKKKMLGAEITAKFTMMQTSDVEFASLDDILAENDFGTTIKFSDQPCALATALTDAGIILENCGVSIGGRVDLGGGESGITVTLTGYCSVAELAGLGTVQGAPYAAGERKISFDAC